MNINKNKVFRYTCICILSFLIFSIGAVYTMYKVFASYDQSTLYYLSSGKYPSQTTPFKPYVYRVYMDTFRDSKEDLLTLYPDPITFFLMDDGADFQTKKNNIQHALDKGISINMQSMNRTKKTPLHNAIVLVDKPMFYFLIAKGAKLDIRDSENHTPLEFAKELLSSIQKRYEKDKTLDDVNNIASLKEMIEYLEKNK